MSSDSSNEVIQIQRSRIRLKRTTPKDRSSKKARTSPFRNITQPQRKRKSGVFSSESSDTSGESSASESLDSIECRAPRSKKRQKTRAAPLTGTQRKRKEIPKILSSESSDTDMDSSARGSNKSKSTPESIDSLAKSKNIERTRKEKEVEQNVEVVTRDDISPPGSYQDSLNDGVSGKSVLQRRRRRLSKSFQSSSSDVGVPKSVNASTGKVGEAVIVPDRATLKQIYSSSIALFQAKKITQKNAFSLKFLECLGDIINGPDFDKNDMHMVGRTLEVGTRIYVCRVDHTYSEVMHLASDIAVRQKKLKEKNKNNRLGDDGEDPENEDGEPARLVIAGRKKKPKQNRFIQEDESKLCTDFEGLSTKYVSRRDKLQKKFTRMINDNVDFDYISYFVERDAPHPLQIESCDDDEGDVVVLPKHFVNAEEMKNIKFLEFNLLDNFDSSLFNVWGMPLGGADVSEGQQGDFFPVDEELVYNPRTRPQNYMEDFETDADTNLSQEYANGGEEAHHDVDISNPIPINRITSLDQLTSYFSAIKDINLLTNAGYGWAGPQFFQPRPRRNWFRSVIDRNKPKKKRKKVIDCTYENFDCKSDENRFISTCKERTLLNARTVTNWSKTKTCIPYLVNENTEYNEDDYSTADLVLNFPMEGEESPDFVDPLLRCFIDPTRNIEGIIQREIEIYDAEDRHTDNRAEFPPDRDTYEPYDVELSAPESLLSSENNLLLGEPVEERIGPPEPEIDNALATLEGIFPTSLGLKFLDDLMTTATDPTDLIKWTKRPKPVNMHALKASVLRILKRKLHMNEDGRPTRDEDTSTTLFELLGRIYVNANKNTMENLSISIIVVALMHVVADQKLFVMPGKVDKNGVHDILIICRGKSWIHRDHIPGGMFPPQDINKTV